MSRVWYLPIEEIHRNATKAALIARPRKTDRHVGRLWLQHATGSDRIYESEPKLRDHLRFASELGREVYRTQLRDHASARDVDPETYRRHAQAAEAALRKLLEHGPIAIGAEDRDEALFRHGRLQDAIGEIGALADAFRGRKKGLHDPALRDAAAAMYGVLIIVTDDEEQLLSVFEDAWIDAGLPDRSDSKGGTKFRTWLRKYLKSKKII